MNNNYQDMVRSVFRMAMFKGTSFKMMLVILYCCTCFVGNAPVIHTWTYQHHSDVCSSKRSCTFILRNLCDGYDRLDQDHWPVLGCPVCGLDSRESASSRNTNDSSAILGKVIFLLESKLCEMSGVHLDTEHTNNTVGALKLKVLVRMERALCGTLSSVCRQNAQMKCCICDWRGLCSLDGSLVYVDIYIMVRLTHPTFTDLCSDSCLGYPGQNEWTLINSSTYEITPSIAKILDNTVDSLNTAAGKSFPYMPSVIRSFLHNLTFNNISNSQGYHLSVSAVIRLTCDIMYMFLITLVLLCKYERKENTGNQDTTTSTSLHIRCFMKCHWYQMHWSWISFVPQKARKESVNYDDIQQLHSTLFLKQTSKQGILYEYIFRPWHWKSGIENRELYLDHSRLGDHHCINHSLFSDCHQHTENFPNPDLMTVHVSPVTRFLPDPTFNHDIDLSHVGYRLATLATLPSHVSVSRVRLAEAGFYFRGRGEEVTCYSCHVCHLDWSRGCDPMDIHRELSPHCQHVLARDHEMASLASGNSQGVHLNSVHSEGSQRPAVSSSTPEDNHVENSDSSETQTFTSLPLPSETTSFPLRSSPSVTSTPEGYSMPMATSVQAQRRVPHERNTHAPHHADPSTISYNTSQNSVTSHSLNVMSGHTESRNVQNSVVNVPNLSASTSRMVNNGSPTLIRTATANANITAEARSLSNVQIQGTGSTSVDDSSSGESLQHLYPRARLDLGRAVYPVYQNMATRRRSFTIGWDNSRAPPLDEVILCGMFYAGYADCVRCFFCGVGLKHWKVTDNVWTEHVRWRPACDYLRAVKGDDYIRATLTQLGISNPTGEAGQDSSQHLAQAQVIQPEGESSQPSTTSTAISSQSQPMPATFLASSSGVTRSTGITSTTNTNAATASSPAAFRRTSPASSEEMRRTVRESQPEPATAAAAPSSSSVDEAGGQRRCGGERGGTEGREREASIAEVVENEQDRLARLQAENRRLSQRFRCHVCHWAAIDTILMPCGHLVMCSTCASSVTSCPMCGHSIRATAHVYMDN